MAEGALSPHGDLEYLDWTPDQSVESFAETLDARLPEADALVATPWFGFGGVVAFDADRMLAFASCGDGKTTVVRAVDGRTFEVAATIATGPGGRTCVIDPKTHMLWVATGERGKDDVRVLGFAAGAVSTPAK